METKETIDVRDAILQHLEEIERPLSWISEKADIPYSSVYSIFKQRTFSLSSENLEKINTALNTDFTIQK